MNKDITIFYIIYIDEMEKGSTGSSVRPIKMLNAFRRLGVNVKVVSGWKNQMKTRRKNLKAALRWLDDHKPVFCYIEPSSGPIYDPLDRKIMKKLHRMGIPVGLFYRDAFWLFPDGSDQEERAGIKDRIKEFVIKQMSVRDVKVIRDTCDVIFVPSETFGQHFDFQNKMCLPPGCEVRSYVDYDEGLICEKEYLTYIFVGGASRSYGIDLTFEAFSRANSNGITAKLMYVCPEEQWHQIKSDVYREEYDSWLTVYHAAGDDELKILYAQADVAVSIAYETIYRSFAVPVKLFEYISYNKPVLSTDSLERSKIIKENDIGWVVPDDADDICAKIKYLNMHRAEVAAKKGNCKEACYKNSWDVRAKQVVTVLGSRLCDTPP